MLKLKVYQQENASFYNYTIIITIKLTKKNLQLYNKIVLLYDSYFMMYQWNLLIPTSRQKKTERGSSQERLAQIVLCDVIFNFIQFM